MKTEDIKHIDQLFKKKLTNHEVAPSDGTWQKLNDAMIREKFSSLEVQPSDAAWEKLNQKLAEEKSPSYRRVLMIAASLSVILMAGYIIISRQPLSPSQKTIVADVQQEIDQIGNEEIVDSDPINSPIPTNIIKEEKSNVSKQLTTLVDTYTNEQDDSEMLPEEINPVTHNTSTIMAVNKIEISYQTSLPELALNKEISNRNYDELSLSISKLSFRDKLKNTWQGIRNLRNSDEKLIDLPKAKNDLFAKASKGLQNGFQKLKINRNNDEETDD